MTDLMQHITKMIEPAAHDLGIEIIRVAYGGARRATLQVMAERPDGTMSVDDCARLSREISAILDVEDPLNEAFILEVSSPGIDRPLTRKKDFENWAGFEAKVELKDTVDGRKRYKGRLIGVSGADQVEMTVDNEHVAFDYNDVAKAKLVLTDDLLDAVNNERAASADEQRGT